MGAVQIADDDACRHGLEAQVASGDSQCSSAETMPPRHLCSAVGCHSERSKECSVLFFRFPKEPVKCKAWGMNVGRKDWRSSDAFVLLSEHFTPDSYNEDLRLLAEFVIPVKNLRLRPGAMATVFAPRHIRPTVPRPNVSLSSSVDTLVGMVTSFLLAGTASTAGSIHWHMLKHALDPDTLQARVQREIDEVIGRERRPTWEDRLRMPFTMASVWEMERWKTGTPLGVPRE
ncbi:hypothetical protein HPB49_010817 [Dermacentor silvarum]|uniref:Uncharacterized protein n=1 Tax=Dermacentor silvarum TaxID=543639 RepID=A0ACB8CEU2_DERSI|nr:hypothetical protein HPB49_010817 [Dermacentor silvarum]